MLDKPAIRLQNRDSHLALVVTEKVVDALRKKEECRDVRPWVVPDSIEKTVQAITVTIVDQNSSDAPADNPPSPVNETSINQTDQINKSITTLLQYGNHPLYDANNNGQETTSGVIDFTVNASFNWEVDESKICTRWQVLDTETSVATRFCDGSKNDGKIARNRYHRH